MHAFRFKFLGVSNIESLFLLYENECYYNGVRVPKFITHYPSKKIIRQGTKRIVDYLTPLVKLNDTGSKIGIAKVKEAKEFMNLDYLDLSTEGSAQLEDLKKYFKLPFKPYLILLRTMVFAGTKLLCEIKETPPLPFGNNPNFNLEILFQQLKVGSLPLEVHLW